MATLENYGTYDPVDC